MHGAHNVKYCKYLVLIDAVYSS
jgi:hypothetical protein